MTEKEDDFLKRLLATFKAEADDHIRAITAGLLQLEHTRQHEKQLPVIETMFREAHSLKGAARSVDMPDVEEICQGIESVFSALKKKSVNVSQQMLDTLLKAMDTIENIIGSREDVPPSSITEILQNVRSLAAGGKHAGTVLRDATNISPDETENLHPPAPGSTREEQLIPAIMPLTARMNDDAVRVSAAKLDSLMLTAEEMVSLKTWSRERIAELRGIISELDAHQKYVLKSMDELRQSFGPNVVNAGPRSEGLEYSHTRMKATGDRLKRLLKSAGQESSAISGMVDGILESVKSATMLPFSSLLETFPKMVREIARAQDKKVAVEISGGEIEISKRILEKIKDPLMHLMRNCIDHGIERPDERVRSGKAQQGTIRISVEHRDNNKIEVKVSDDGTGIDPKKIKLAAAKREIVREEELNSLGDHELLSLIFRPEVSTSAIITNISGRGLGLAIVRERIEKVGGSVSVETIPGSGTIFKIVLPLTISTFRGILIRSGGHLFIISTLNVKKALRIRKDAIKTIENKESIRINGKAYSLVSLSDALEIIETRKDKNTDAFVTVLLLGAAEEEIAFVVDEIVNEQEILIKGLGSQLLRVRNISGAALLGSGMVVPVLNVSDLMKSALKTGPATSISRIKDSGTSPGNILVAEDSITTRTLFKNILESSGYRVKTAVDGIEALAALKTEDFDLVVSDVQMPGMDGFELTEKIRGDNKLAKIPVVLVTGLESNADRERGIEAGANAYIVKSSFDQSNLLEIISQLI